MKLCARVKCIVSISASLLGGNVLAKNIEYSNNYSILGSSSVYSFQSENVNLNIKKASHSFLGDEEVADISSLDYVYGVDGKKYHAAFSYSQDEQYGTFGYSVSGVTVSAMAGKSESFLHDAGSFKGVGRFGLHGGNNIGFSFHGAGVNTQFIGGVNALFGFTELTSNFSSVENRGVRYFELSSQGYSKNVSGLYSRFSVIDRGDIQIGQALEAGLNYKQASIMFQGMKVEGNKRLLRSSANFYANESTQLGFDLSKVKDPFHYNETRYTALLSLSRILDVRPQVYFGAESDVFTLPKAKKRKSLVRPIIIGSAAVSIASLASSGDESVDNSIRKKEDYSAAFEVLNNINPISVRENREYGGWIYRKQDGTYSYTRPVRGDNDSVALPRMSSSEGRTITATYHTHAGHDAKYDNENFSASDISNDNKLGIGGYLATPLGKLKYHFGDDIQTLGIVAN